MTRRILPYLLLIICDINGATVLTPAGLENTDGNRAFGFQFNGERYQQAYAASLFQNTGSPWIEISELRFRVDQNAPLFTTNPELEVRLSTTSQDPDFLGANWAANTGADALVVLPRSVVNWSASITSSDIVLTLPNHFLYSPNNGNLLLDVSIFDIGREVGLLDAHSASFDGISSRIGSIGTANATSGGSDGLVTKFVYQVVPEPGTIALILIGSLMLVFATKFKHGSS